jgi:hypothetical protein
MLNEAGFRGDVIERQLAHGERNEIRGAYLKGPPARRNRVLEPAPNRAQSVLC